MPYKVQHCIWVKERENLNFDSLAVYEWHKNAILNKPILIMLLEVPKFMQDHQKPAKKNQMVFPKSFGVG